MSVDQISSPSPSRRSRSSLNAMIFIAVAVVGFAVLHIIGGTLLQRQSTAVPSIETSAVHGD